MGTIAGIYGYSLKEQECRAVKATMGSFSSSEIRVLAESQMTLLHSGPREKKEPCVQMRHAGKSYWLSYIGKIYNLEDVKKELTLTQDGYSEGKILLMAYLKWGKAFLERLNGAFSIVIYNERENTLFLSRDPLGLKPLFYEIRENQLLFSSQMDTLLAFPGPEPVLDKTGAAEILLLGPGRKPGSGIIKGISELKPGCWAVFKNGNLFLKQYWHLEDREHRDSFQETAWHVRELVEKAVKSRTEDLPDYGTFLSGGLDSSILSALAARENPQKPLQTFSVDYLHNDQFFTPGKFQPDSDEVYIGEMTDFLKARHRNIVLTPENLMAQLETATIARGFPGMGDVDFSLLAFCREVRKSIPAVLSGECADEIFGGYPWFRDPELMESGGFPWAGNLQARIELMGFSFRDPGDFVMDCAQRARQESCVMPVADDQERKIKELVNLNMYWFMQTLVDRNECMSRAAGLEVRVPFCDVSIAQYLYSVPWAFKEYGGREKGLLRYAFQDLLPESVRLRKKSPYPKTFDPAYEQVVMAMVRELFGKDLPIWHMVRRESAEKLLQQGTNGPFYGQLMKKPQIAAWILQLNLWLEHYNIQFLF